MLENATLVVPAGADGRAALVDPRGERTVVELQVVPGRM
jgi:hypothetical protein